MAAELFTVPFQCVVVSGLAVPGATLTFYQTGTTTKLPVYTTSALTTQQTNPVVANGAGHIPDTYLNTANTYRLVVKDRFGTELDDIDPYIPGVTTLGITLTSATGQSVNSKGALAALSPVVNNQVAFLTDGSMFVFDSSNLSASVTADPREGVYVAPASASTGASGAWVRKVTGYHNVQWWDTVADDATDDGAAFTAAIAYLKTQKNAATYGEAGPSLFIPKGQYYLGTTTLDLTCGIHMFGESLGEAGGQPSQLRWAVNTPGIRVQRYNTTGDSGTYAGTSNVNGGDASIIEKLMLKGGGTSDANYNAILLRARATVRDVYIENWQGDGIKIVGGGVGVDEGNANNWSVSKVLIQNCRNGMFVDGANANVGIGYAVSAISCRAWGIVDSSFLGNTWIGCHTAANGSGPYTSIDPNARCVFVGCYSESDQSTSVFSVDSVVIGGLHGAGVSGGAYARADLGAYRINELVVDGDVTVGWEDDPTAKLVNIRWGSTVRINNDDNSKYWTANVTHGGQLLLTTAYGGDLKVGGKVQADFEMNLNGGVYKIDGTQVVKSRRAAVGHATATASASPLLAEYNDLVARFNNLVDYLGATSGHGLTAD